MKETNGDIIKRLFKDASKIVKPDNQDWLDFLECHKGVLSQSRLLMSKTLWPDLITDIRFIEALDPSTSVALLSCGRLGTLFGADLYTDAYEDPSTTDKLDLPTGFFAILNMSSS